MNDNAQPADELENLFPAEVTVSVAGETFVLKAWTARHSRPYIRINGQMQAKAAALGRELAQAHAAQVAAAEAAGIPAPAAPDADSIPLALLHERCYEEYAELVQVATGKPLAWVEELGIDELIALAGIINELNRQRYEKKAPTLTVTAGRQSQ